jgi:hypothetical protein
MDDVAGNRPLVISKVQTRSSCRYMSMITLDYIQQPNLTRYIEPNNSATGWSFEKTQNKTYGGPRPNHSKLRSDLTGHPRLVPTRGM